MKYNFLKSTSHNLSECPGVFDWDGMDSKRHYKMSYLKYSPEKRAKLKLKNSDKKINYTLNSYGYRCSEFDTVDWKNTIVTLGCSNTYGVSVDDCETYTHHLQNNLDIPFVNLGQGSTDIWFQIYNSIELMKLNIRGVVLQVPSTERLTTFHSNNETKNYGAWNMTKSFSRVWSGEQNLIQWNLFGYDYIRKILGDKLLYSFSFTTANHLPIDLIPQCDTGRDDSHPGPKSHKMIAEKIEKELHL